MRSKLILCVATLLAVGCTRERFSRYRGDRPVTFKQVPDHGLDARGRALWLEAHGYAQIFAWALLDSPRLDGSLSADEIPRAQSILSDLDECTVQQLGPACLGEGTDTAMSYEHDEDTMQTEITTTVKMPGSDSPLRLAFSFDDDHLAQQKAWLTVRSGNQIWLTSDVDLNFRPAALERLRKLRSIRELYHMSLGLMESVEDHGQSQLRAHLSNVFAASVPLLLSPGRENYEFETLKMALTELAPPAKSLIAMGDELLNSKADDVDQLAAVAILKNDPPRTSIRGLVIGAMSSARSDLRRLGIEAMSVAKDREDTQTALILNGVLDRDPSVRATALAAVNQTEFNFSHRADIMALALNSDPAVRQEGIQLLAQIHARSKLIEMLSDTNPALRSEAMAALKTQKANSYDIAVLESQMKNPESSVRLGVAQVMATIPGEDATRSLITHLDEADPSVRDSILQSLAPRPLGTNMIGSLEVPMISANADARLAAQSLLNRIPGYKSSIALIEHLDDSSPAVRDAIAKELEARDQTLDLVDAYAKKISSPDLAVRTVVVRLLAKMRRTSANLILGQRAQIEPDSALKAQIVAALKQAR